MVDGNYQWFSAHRDGSESPMRTCIFDMQAYRGLELPVQKLEPSKAEFSKAFRATLKAQFSQPAALGNIGLRHASQSCFGNACAECCLGRQSNGFPWTIARRKTKKINSSVLQFRDKSYMGIIKVIIFY